jgi:ferric-dicitrate binding protein FerR (iron transport regulator)
MNSNDEQIRAAIAEQACKWFVANEEGPMDARDSAGLAAWWDFIDDSGVAHGNVVSRLYDVSEQIDDGRV